MERATDKQIAYLKKLDPSANTEGLTKREASELIEKILKERRQEEIRKEAEKLGVKDWSKEYLLSLLRTFEERRKDYPEYYPDNLEDYAIIFRAFARKGVDYMNAFERIDFIHELQQLMDIVEKKIKLYEGDGA